MTRTRQIFNLTVTTKGRVRPSHIVRTALSGHDSVDGFTLAIVGPAVSLPSPDRDRLIELAAWAAGEQAKQELGLPSEWDQRDWLVRTDCGTACCLAGKVALDDGGVPADRGEGSWNGDWAAAQVGQVTTRVKFPGKDEAVRVEDYAREALGLTDAQAYRLFAGSNDLSAVLAVIREILAGDDEPTPVRARRRRLGVTGTGHGPECDICYEDVPDSESTEPAT